MRTHSARAKPMSISRAARNGNASLRMSAVVTSCISSRERGPWMLICAYAAGHVGRRTRGASSGTWRFIHVSTWRCAVSDATTQKRSSSSFVTVRSASSLPASLSHCVYVICPRAPSTLLAEIQLSSAPGVASLDEELRHERHVHEDHALARGLVLGLPVREPAAACRTTASTFGFAPAARTSRRPPSR